MELAWCFLDALLLVIIWKPRRDESEGFVFVDENMLKRFLGVRSKLTHHCLGTVKLLLLVERVGRGKLRWFSRDRLGFCVKFYRFWVLVSKSQMFLSSTNKARVIADNSFNCYSNGPEERKTWLSLWTRMGLEQTDANSPAFPANVKNTTTTSVRYRRRIRAGKTFSLFFSLDELNEFNKRWTPSPLLGW